MAKTNTHSLYHCFWSSDIWAQLNWDFLRVSQEANKGHSWTAFPYGSLIKQESTSRSLSYWQNHFLVTVTLIKATRGRVCSHWNLFPQGRLRISLKNLVRSGPLRIISLLTANTILLILDPSYIRKIPSTMPYKII